MWRSGRVSSHNDHIRGISDRQLCIPQYMFQYCTSLESIDLTGITDIGPDAFNNCVSLSELVLPEGLKTIGDRAFIQCHSLVSVTTPESLV